MPPLVRHRRRPGAISWLIAAACLMMMLAASAVLALDQAARGLQHAIASRVIVQVIEPDRARRDTLTAQVLATLQARHDVVALRQVGLDEVSRLIGPYLGQTGLAELPLPALIDLTVAPGADVAGLAAALGRLGPITAEPAGAGLGPLGRMIATLRAIALAFTGIAAAATALIAILGGRAALAAEGPTVAILHGLGATDGQVARAITGQIVRDAAIGVLIGAMVAVGAMALLARRMAALNAGIDAVAIGTGGWAILGLLMIGLVALATGAAHIALLMRLGRTP